MKLLALLVFLLTQASMARAHDLERTQVSITFETDGRFVLEVANNPDWMLERLEPFAGEYPLIPVAPRAGRPTDSERDARLATLAPVFIDRIVVFVDHDEIRPASAEYIAPPARARADDPSHPGVYRLRGRVPADATTLRWYYGLVIDRYPLIVHRPDGHALTEWVAENAWSGSLSLRGQFHAPTRLETARQYLWLGWTHVLPNGIDHILFVLGIFFLAVGFRPLLVQLAAFTVAHGIALALALYGVMTLPPAVVDPLVALSIAYVAIENLVTIELKPWRVAVIFLVGVVHGVRLAGVLGQIGLTRAEFTTALLTFNLGIEGGQWLVIAATATAVFSYRNRVWYRERIVIPASLAIAAVAVYWTIRRTFG